MFVTACYFTSEAVTLRPLSWPTQSTGVVYPESASKVTVKLADIILKRSDICGSAAVKTRITSLAICLPLAILFLQFLISVSVLLLKERSVS